jgi:hypothetical protein
MKHRGNRPAAVVALDAVIADATALVALTPSAALSDALARAKHDRGTLAYEMEQPAVAVSLYYEALQLYQDENSRERALLDMASGLADLGLHDAARDANMVLYATAGDVSLRHMAACNLMYLANETRQELLFTQYRRALADVELSPEILAYFQVIEGEGLYLFGHRDQARAALERSLETAERYQQHALVHRAETALNVLARRAAPATPMVNAEAPAAIDNVVTAVRRLRETAEASA